MYSFLKAFLVLMKLLSLSQLYAPKCVLQLIFLWNSLANADPQLCLTV